MEHKPTTLYHLFLLMANLMINGFSCLEIDCDFEVDSCGWNQSIPTQGEQTFRWERHQGPTDTEFTGPTSGHGGVDSWYMYVDGSGSFYDAQAALSSPFVVNPEGQRECYCFTFWYHMSGEQVGSLSVLLFSTQSGMTEALWHQNAQRGNGWHRGGVQFTEQGHFKLLIIAKRGSGPRSDIAIDDLRLAKSYCGSAEQPNVISDFFECDNGRLISTALYCDGEDQCGDSSDESDRSCMEAQGLIGGFSMDALTITGIIILLLLITVLIVLLVIICHRRQQVETKPRPQHHSHNQDVDRHLMGGQNRRANNHITNQNGTNVNHHGRYYGNQHHNNGVVNCYDEEDRVRLTKCDDLSPSHFVRIDSPPPYESIIVENDGNCDKILANDQHLILPNPHAQMQPPENEKRATGVREDCSDTNGDNNLIDVSVDTKCPSNQQTLKQALPPDGVLSSYAPQYVDNSSNQTPLASPLPTAPPLEVEENETDMC